VVAVRQLSLLDLEASEAAGARLSQRDLTAMKLYLLGWTQEQIQEQTGQAARLARQAISQAAASISAEYAKGFSASEIAKRYAWPEPLVWAVVLREKSDLEKFKALGWPLRTWDFWYFADCDRRFGDPWPGQIPAQLIAHALYYFTLPGQVVFDPMAGGGVVPDVCLALNRRCYAVDMKARPDRPEIIRHYWDPHNLSWPEAVGKTDFIFWDPPYFQKMAADYGPDSISALPREEYLRFFAAMFRLFHVHSAPGARLALLVADWRAFQSTPALEEDPGDAVLLYHYWQLLEEAGWRVTHRIECPLSTQRMHPGVVAAMQKKRVLGVVTRTLLVAQKRKE